MDWERNRLCHWKLKLLGQMSQSHVLISTSDRKDMSRALILQQELASSWGRAFPSDPVSPLPPRMTGEGRPSPLANPGLLPRVLEGNQVTHILLLKYGLLWLGKLVSFKPRLQRNICSWKDPSTQPTRPAPQPDHWWVIDTKGRYSLYVSLLCRSGQ